MTKTHLNRGSFYFWKVRFERSWNAELEEFDSRVAHGATEYANQKGKGLEFHRAVFDHYYRRGEDVSQWVVLREVSLEVGLDADEMQGEVEDGKFTRIVSDQVNEVHKLASTAFPPTS